MGRLLEDSVSAFGTGINTIVQKIIRTYDVRGRVEFVTSHGSGSPGTVRYQVKFVYDFFNQLKEDWQEHAGAVTGTSKKVRYTHESGAGNTARRTAMLYLDGTIFGYVYASGINDALSRVSMVKIAGSDLTSYRYLGLNTVVGVKNIAASNTEQTYESGGTGDAGDPYVGLDRFGRLVETLWKTGSTIRVRSKYGRNRRGGIVWRRDEEAHAQSVTTEDKFFWYDGVYRVEQYQRGQLVGTAPNYTGITSKQQDEEPGRSFALTFRNERVCNVHRKNRSQRAVNSV